MIGKRQVVVLDVPIEDKQASAAFWRWNQMLNTSRAVIVMGTSPVFEVDENVRND